MPDTEDRDHRARLQRLEQQLNDTAAALSPVGLSGPGVES